MNVEAEVFTARCIATTEHFGVRVQRELSAWVMTWAFPLTAQTGAGEGYRPSAIEGVIIGDDYPGCPHCGRGSVMSCGVCGTVTYLAVDEAVGRCAGCGYAGPTVDGFGTSGSGDR